MKQIRPNLWFDGKAEDAVLRAPADNPATRKGDVVLVEFTLLGQRFVGINGGSKDPDIAERCLTAMLGMGKIDIAALERAASTPNREMKRTKGEIP